MRAFALLPLLGSLLFGAVVRAQTPTTLEQFYDALAKDGSCAIYVEKGKSSTPALAGCKTFCTGKGEREDSQSCQSPGEIKETDPLPRDPNGDKFFPGKCKCGSETDPVAEEIFVPVLEALSKLDEILCAVMLQAIVESINIGFAFVPGGQSVAVSRAATKAAVEGAKTMAENSMSSADFFDGWIKAVCGLEAIEVNYDQTFDSLVNAPDSFGTSKGCKRKNPASCKKPDPKPDPPKKPDEQPKKPEEDKPKKPEEDQPKKPDDNNPKKPDDNNPKKPDDNNPKKPDDNNPEKPDNNNNPDKPEDNPLKKPDGSQPKKPDPDRPRPTTTKKDNGPTQAPVSCSSCRGKKARNAAREARWGSMFVPRAPGQESCLLDRPRRGSDSGKDSCEATGGVAARDGGLLSTRALTEDNPMVKLAGRTDIKIPCGKHKSCADAMQDSGIDKFYYLEGDPKCGGDLRFGGRRDIDNKKFQNDHVYEKQTLAKFFEWLGNGDMTAIGQTTKPQVFWVVEVLLDTHTDRYGPLMPSPDTQLGIPEGGAALDEVMAYGIARSDPLDRRQKQGAGMALDKTTRNFALVEANVNENKGKFFKLATPDTLESEHPTAANKNRAWIREHAAVFHYLNYAHTAGSNKEPVWNKWMRVSNWIDLVLHEFDRSYPWGTHADEPRRADGGAPSLRSLYAHWIHEHLEAIEANAQRWARVASREFQARYRDNAPAARQWVDKAFGTRGFATPGRMVFPRPGGGAASQFGAYGHPTLTLDKNGNQVNIGPPAPL